MIKLSLACILIMSTFIGGLAQSTDKTKTDKIQPMKKSEEEWKKSLTPEQYYVLRQKGTERAYTGEYWDNHDKGIYYCAACHQELFISSTKFESGTGWPSFYQPFREDVVKVATDNTHGMTRDEVVCSRCGDILDMFLMTVLHQQDYAIV